MSTRSFYQGRKKVISIERYRRLSLGLPVPVVRGETRVPLGYKINPDNPKELIIEAEVFDVLKKARVHLKGSSYRDVLEWLKGKGIKVSLRGLYVLMRDRPPYTDDERASYYGR